MMKAKLFMMSAACLLLGLEVLTAQVTYRVYATRIGLVGQTTANGHVIQSNDRLVALPSRTVLNSKGGYTYTVNLRNPANGKTINNVPVWDIGPWNCDDNYWSANRNSLIQPPLPRGKPQAQAAYQDGHNGGRDFSSSCGPGRSNRIVLNPAGIDLSNRVFWNDLGMTNNGWIDVTFNWESSGQPSLDNHLDAYVRRANTVYYKRRLVGSGWSDWSSLGGSGASDPAGVSWQVGTVRVFVRDTNGDLRFRRYEDGAWSSVWSQLGKPSVGFTGRPNAASRGVGHIIVGVRGNDNTLWTRSLSNGSWGSWTRFSQTEGQVLSSPAVVSVDPDRVDIFYRGPNDSLRRLYFVLGSNWNGPVDLGGSLIENPDAFSPSNNKASMYSRGWDGNLWRKDMTIGSGYTSWTPIGTGGIASSPASSRTGNDPNRQDVLFRSASNNLHQIYQTGGTWSSPVNHGQPGGNILGGPGAVTWNK